MRSIVFSHCGEPADVLFVTETPMSEPSPGEVRIRMTARPINPSDLLLIRGRYGRPARFGPLFPGAPPTALVGFEGAGVVDKAAPGIQMEPGSRVAVSADGTWQEYVNVPVTDIIEIPDSLPDDLACQMTVNPLTANLLLDDLGLTAGDVLLQTAAASAVGKMITALARQRGIRCAGLVRRHHRSSSPPDDDVREIVADPPQRAREQMERFAGDCGVAAALDAVGGVTGRLALNCVRDGGRMTVYGMLSGSPIPVSPDALVFRGITLAGFWLPQRLKAMSPAAVDDLIRTVTGQLTRRELAAPVAGRHGLDDIKAAVQHSEADTSRGKVLLVS